MAFGLVAAGQMASTLFPSTSILITWLSLLNVGDEFGCADDPIWHTVSASSRAKPCYPDGQSNPGKGWGKAHSSSSLHASFDKAIPGSENGDP
jgi:hypothetical protein